MTSAESKVTRKIKTENPYNWPKKDEFFFIRDFREMELEEGVMVPSYIGVQIPNLR
jgi:hypothetical protein